MPNKKKNLMFMFAFLVALFCSMIIANPAVAKPHHKHYNNGRRYHPHARRDYHDRYYHDRHYRRNHRRYYRSCRSGYAYDYNRNRCYATRPGLHYGIYYYR